MNLVWKLLRQHISVPQFTGFFMANLFGMFIILLSYQFYNDVLPIFTSQDSFMKAEYLIVSKRIGMGNSNSFTHDETERMAQQKFCKNVGAFSSTEYKVDASMGVNGQQVLNSELFFESVPDEFIDVPLQEWAYTPGCEEVPIILPRTYINMYNFGFAQSHSLPKINEGLVGMIDFKLFIHGNGFSDQYKGKVIGFSNRLSTILVPQAFMKWSNERYAPGQKSDPTRLIMEVDNPTDEGITSYLENNGYEVENDKLQAEKTTYFLRLTVTLVMIIGLIISALSFYILMLSIYLLVQKNTTKLENLLLIGYSPAKVALPYQLLTVTLNMAVLIITWCALYFVRGYYMDLLETLFPQIEYAFMTKSVLLGTILFMAVTAINQLAIRRKIMNIWNRKE